MTTPEILTTDKTDLTQKSVHPLNEEGYPAHHWVIDSPSGQLSTGTCKLCREKREFRNSYGDYLWESGNPQPGQTWRKDEQIRITKSIYSDGNELE